MPSWTVHGPLSLSGAVLAAPSTADVEQLEVVKHPKPNSRYALVSQVTAERLSGGGPLLLELSGSDCVLSVCSADGDDVSAGCLALTPVQQHNLHIKEGCRTAFRRFVPPSLRYLALVDVELEVSSLGGYDAVLEVDGTQLAQRFVKAYLGHVVAVNEACIFSSEECGDDRGDEGSAADCQPQLLLLRVCSCNSLDEEAQAEAVAYHCYRGVVTPETAVYLRAIEPTSTGSGSAGGAVPQSVLLGREGVALRNARARPLPGQSRNLVDVHTADGECFPVNRRLLRPCIALTEAVRSEEAGTRVDVGVGTLTFDRVLIFLEAEALGRPPPRFGIHLVPALAEAAGALGLASLSGYCERRLGDCAARRRWMSFDEVQRRNAAGECLLLMDFMVLDVTRWLPEHPGGAAIIPAQALNVDSCRLFEVYHASRESFVYLREFYVGEVVPGDRAAVPHPAQGPSPEFMRQLREHTQGFRLKEGEGGEGGGRERSYKSF